MRAHAKKQLAPISIRHLKETLRTMAPEVFDKMIIAENEPIKRCNYIYVSIAYQQADRLIFKVKFPLYPSVLELFTEYEGGVAKHGEKARMPSDKLIETLVNSWAKEGQPILPEGINNPFEFPFDTEKGEIATNQADYFFPALSYRETCNQCYGHKYVNCNEAECSGRHKWSCPTCQGKGILPCENCGGNKFTDCPSCSGSLQIKCRRCGGDGRVNDSWLAKNIFKFFLKEKLCGDCAGKGSVPCPDCENGKIACTECKGIGKTICPECASQGTITCFNCYGDAERLGKANCPQCHTEGETGQVVYVQTRISSKHTEKFIQEGKQLRISETRLKKHLQPEQKPELVYKKVNQQVLENYNEYTGVYARKLEKELGLYKAEFPMLLKEEVFYQVIPCITSSYKHVLTNTVHEFTIIDFWEKPEIIFHSEPEQLKRSTGDAAKLIGSGFAGLFKTKGHKAKMDLRNEIILLIHLAKADGRIDDREKALLSLTISGLKDFTNAEKQKLFDVLNSPVLPDLTKGDVQFSSPGRKQEVLEKLNKMAGADGVASEAEKVLMEKIKALV